MTPSQAISGSPPFPLGVNPETYQADAVHALLKEAAYFTLFALPDPDNPDVPISSRGNPDGLIGVQVNERPHRFDIRPAQNTPGRGLRTVLTTGESVARVSMRWMPCPDDWVATPGIDPPPTRLNPRVSQRFVMLDGEMTFDDRERSGFRAVGAGRTYPMWADGRLQLGLGSVIEVIEGLGRFKGLEGLNVVNGYIDPPYDLRLCFTVRMMDPGRRLSVRDSDFSPLHPIHDPAPGTSVIAVLGETVPEEPVTLNFGPGGTMIGSNVVERLRLVHIGYEVGGRRGLRSRTEQGPIVGELRGRLNFNPADKRPSFPISTNEGRLSFFDTEGNTIGSLFADIHEGTAFRTELPGAPMPVFRLGGYGPFAGGTGVFSGVNGMMSLNAVVSVFPRTLSNLYVLRINDPEGRFRASLWDAWF